MFMIWEVTALVWKKQRPTTKPNNNAREREYTVIWSLA